MKSRVRFSYVGILALLSGTLAASRLISGQTPDMLERPLTSITAQIAGWEMVGGEELLSRRQLNATSYVARTYKKEGDRLGLLIAFHDSHQAAISIHNPKNCLPGDGWEILTSQVATVSFNGRRVAINQYQIYRAGQRMTVLYWYQSRNRITANEYLAKLLLVRDAVFERRTSGSIVRVALPDRPELLSEAFRFAEGVMQQAEFCFRP